MVLPQIKSNAKLKKAEWTKSLCWNNEYDTGMFKTGDMPTEATFTHLQAEE